MHNSSIFCVGGVPRVLESRNHTSRGNRRRNSASGHFHLELPGNLRLRVEEQTALKSSKMGVIVFCCMILLTGGQ